MKRNPFFNVLNVTQLLLPGIACLIFGTTLASAQADVKDSEGYMIGILNPQEISAASEPITVGHISTPDSGTQFIWLPYYFEDVGRTLPPAPDSSTTSRIIYADFYLLPSVFPSHSKLPEISNYPIAALTGLVSTEKGMGEFVVVYGNGAGDGIWQYTDNYIELENGKVPESLWYVYKMDYTNKRYDFFLNGTLIAEKVPFIDSNMIQLDQTEVKSDREETLHFDQLNVSYDRPDQLDLEIATISLDETETTSGQVTSISTPVSEPLLATEHTDPDLYVDCEIGSDSYDGLSATPGNPTGLSGPKVTIASAIAAAGDSDTISLQSCTYEETILDANGKNLTLLLNGNVIIN